MSRDIHHIEREKWKIRPNSLRACKYPDRGEKVHNLVAETKPWLFSVWYLFLSFGLYIIPFRIIGGFFGSSYRIRHWLAPWGVSSTQSSKCRALISLFIEVHGVLILVSNNSVECITDNFAVNTLLHCNDPLRAWLIFGTSYGRKWGFLISVVKLPGSYLNIYWGAGCLFTTPMLGRWTRYITSTLRGQCYT